MGSGDTLELLGGGGGGWCGDGSKWHNSGGPGTGVEGDGEAVIGCSPGVSGSTGGSRCGGPEGDGGDHLGGVDGNGTCGSNSFSSGGDGVGWGALGSGAGTNGGGGGDNALPRWVPDIGDAGGVTVVTDGTEGFAPSVSVGEDGGGEGAPSTDGLGSGEVGPDLGGSWRGS